MQRSSEAGWLHALWGERVRVAPHAAARPQLAPGLLRLPGAEAALRRAACAHAAAHWRFGGPPQPRRGLKPIQQALLETLEDARVEWLALRELPGLRALWLPFHERDAPQGLDFAALLARLARSLLAGDVDPHPWIARVCSEFFTPAGELRLEGPAAVRALASRLGNDMGQMRLPFNAGSHRVHAAYRDDGSWLWEPEEAQPEADAGVPPPLDEEPHLYPEWDERIGRYRDDWCQVRVRAAALEPLRALPRAEPPALDGLARSSPRMAGRAAWGDEFHAMVLVDACVQRRAGQAPEPQVYRRRDRAPALLAVQLLVDASASSEGLLGGWLAQALACARELEAQGHASALLAFASWTRERVEVRPLKHWDESAAAPAVLARCRALASGGSTRLGAALRHAAAEAARQPGRQPVVAVFSDGEVHDADASAAYLQADLRRALAEAARAGVLVRRMDGAAFLQWGA